MESEQDEIHNSTSEDATSGNGVVNAEETVEVEKEPEGTRDSSSEQAENDLNVIGKIADQNETLLERTQLILDMVCDNNDKGQLISKLFAKTEKMDQDFVFNKILKRVFMDLIRLYDRVNGIRADLASDNEMSEQVLQYFESIRSEVLRALKRNDVCIDNQLHPRFDERYQEAIAIRSVETPDEDMNVLEIVQDGFNYQDKVFRAARVVVGKFEKKQKQEE